MGLLQRLFGKSSRDEALVKSTPWLRDGNLVYRRFTALTSAELAVMHFFARCEFLNREPVLLLTFDVQPPINAMPGYLSARCSSSSGDSGYLVVELVQEREATSIRFIDGSEKRIVPQFSDGQTNRLWLGGEGSTLLQLTIPSEPGFETQIEQAWKWEFDNVADMSKL